MVHSAFSLRKIHNIGYYSSVQLRMYCSLFWLRFHFLANQEKSICPPVMVPYRHLSPSKSRLSTIYIRMLNKAVLHEHKYGWELYRIYTGLLNIFDR